MDSENKALSWLPAKPRKRIEAAVHAYAADSGDDEFERLFERAPQPMWLYDLATLKFLDVNQAAITRYGYSRREFLSMTIEDIRPRDDVKRLHARIADLRSNDPRDLDRTTTYWRHVRKNGAIIWVDIHSQISRYRNRHAALVVAVDVTGRKHAEERVAIQQAYFRQLFDSSSDAILLLDQQDAIVDANQRFMKMFGYEPGDVIGALAQELVVPEKRRQGARLPPEAVEADSPIYREARRRRKDGTLLDVAVSRYPIVLETRRVGAYLRYRDLSEKKRLLKRVRYHATHDAVTGLINRREFDRQVRALLRKPQSANVAHVVLHVALDQFALFARTHGRATGKRLLGRVVARMTATAGSDIIAHLYADEFCILLPSTDRDSAWRIAEQLVEDIVAIDLRRSGTAYRIGANIGGVMLDATSVAPRTVLSMAEIACQVAKEKGANKVHIAAIDDPETARHQSEVYWLSEIHEALDEDRFVLYAQRIVPLNGSSRRHDCEILVRLLDRDDNVIAPGEFIPVAERYRLMCQLDRWLLDKLFGCLDKIARESGLADAEVSVNLSGETLGDDELADYIKSLFAKYRVSPKNICFEITETAAIQNIALASRFTGEMRALGARIALDDFGSGMSSFRYLRELSIDYLKIDGLFIKDMLANDADRAMTEAISRMAQALGIVTIAEWVESLETLDCLRELGVDYAQGFAIHRPEPLTAELLIP